MNFPRSEFHLNKMSICFKKNCLGLTFSYIFPNFIQVASSALGFGPQMAMQLAERLYTQGYIRFSSALVPTFCLIARLLLAYTGCSQWPIQLFNCIYYFSGSSICSILSLHEKKRNIALSRLFCIRENSSSE